MKLNTRSLALAALSVLAAGIFAAGPKPSANELIASIKAVQTPTFDASKRGDRAYINQYLADMAKANVERNKLTLELYHDYPDNEEVPKLMDQRWSTLLSGTQRTPADLEAAIKETSGVAASNAPVVLKTSAAFWEANYKVDENEGSPAKALAAVNDFIKAYPKDDRGARLLTTVGYQTSDPATLLSINKEILSNYPSSPGAKYATGIIRRIQAVGKPFDLSFTDAVSGNKVSIADLKGKVVLIDFWATWCGPCVAEMPQVKELYAKYHSKGLEILGVSLDQPVANGGLDKLKAFVAKNQMPWAQYYQGNFWNSEFSTSWGINSIPSMFIIDTQGNLLDVDGRTDTATKVAKLLDN